MKWYYCVIIGIVAYAYLQNPNTFMDAPVDNILDVIKQLTEKVTDIDIGGDGSTGKTNYGKPDCLDNTDCNTINKCQTDLCVCGDGGSCYG